MGAGGGQEWVWEVAKGCDGILEGLDGDEVYVVARVLTFLGESLQSHYADYEKANTVLEQALIMRQAALPAGHTDIATSLNSLACVLDSQGRYKEAGEMYRDALRMSQAALPTGHSNLATSLDGLASVLDKGIARV